MKGRFKFFWLIACVGLLFETQAILADSAGVLGSDDPTPDLQCARGGNGGEIPTPFDFRNQRVELADGEYYELVGWVVMGPSKSGSSVQAYFKVDLNEHPWLANAKRIANPYYPLEGDAAFWSRYNGHRVQLTVQARAGISLKAGFDAQYVISLKAIPETLVEMQTSHMD